MVQKTLRTRLNNYTQVGGCLQTIPIKWIPLQFPVAVSQARPTSGREGRVWWTVYTSRVPLHCTVQSNHVALFCHMTHYINVWVAIAILKCQKRARTYFCYCRNCKKHFSGSLLSPQQVIQERIFQIWLHHPANCILVGHGLYTQFTMQTLPFLGLACETTLWHVYRITRGLSYHPTLDCFNVHYYSMKASNITKGK